MNNAMPKEELERILDQAVRDVTERAAGVRLPLLEKFHGTRPGISRNHFIIIAQDL